MSDVRRKLWLLLALNGAALFAPEPAWAQAVCPSVSPSTTRLTIIAKEFDPPSGTCVATQGNPLSNHGTRNEFQLRNLLDRGTRSSDLDVDATGLLYSAYSNGVSVPSAVACTGGGCGATSGNLSTPTMGFPEYERFVECNALAGAGDCTFQISYTNFQGDVVTSTPFTVGNLTSTIPSFTMSGGGFVPQQVPR
jgi:hypothetical protein